MMPPDWRPMYTAGMETDPLRAMEQQHRLSVIPCTPLDKFLEGRRE